MISGDGQIPVSVLACEHCGSPFNYTAMDWFGKLSLTLICSTPENRHPGWWADENAIHAVAVAWFMENA